MNIDGSSDERPAEGTASEGARLGELIDHIETRHHTFMRREFPRLQALLEKAQAQQGGRYGMVLSALREHLGALSSETELHLLKEEQVLFPYIRQLEYHARRGGRKPARQDDGFAELKHDHENASDLLARIRRVTGNYAVPDDACEALRTLYDGLDAMEADLQPHIVLEDNVLFPLAIELQRSMAVSKGT